MRYQLLNRLIKVSDHANPEARRIFLCSTLIALAIGGYSAPALSAGAGACDRSVYEGETIGLVLGGGGARGSAHIGVIRVLEEMRVPVHYVGGTSIGSLVGGLFATGMTADELERVILEIDWDDLFNDETAREDLPFRRKRDDNLALFGEKLGIGKGSTLLPPGAVAGQKISFLFETLTREHVQTSDFDQLPIPYRAVAADILTGRQVVLDSGALSVAMRASMSVPGVFDPVPYGDALLVDGGIVNNVPIDVVRSMGADRIIAVDVGTPLSTREQLVNPLAIVSQLSGLMIKSNVNAQLDSLGRSDLLITPELGDEVTSGAFNNSQAGMKIGYSSADAMRAQLASFALSESDYAAYRRSLATCQQALPVIDFIRLVNRSRLSDEVIERRLTIQAGQPLDRDELDENLRQIHALGFIELARYEVVNEDGSTGVVIDIEPDPRGKQMIEWGLDFSGDGDSNSLDLRVGYLNNAVDHFGSELRLIAQVGEEPALFADLYKYLGPGQRFFIEPQVYARRTDFTRFERGQPTAQAEIDEIGGSFAVGAEIGRSASILGGIRAFSGDVDGGIGSGPSDDFSFDGGEFFTRMIVDRLDDRYFPGRGGFMDARILHGDSSLGSDDEYSQFAVDSLVARTEGRNTFMVGGRFYATIEDTAPVYSLFRAGGFARLSGFSDDEIAGQNFAMGLLGYRYRVAGGGLMPAFVGTTLEYGNISESRSDLFEDGLLHGSFYFGFDSPMGPLYVGAGLGEGGNRRLFIRIGNVFGTSRLGR